MKQYYGTKQLRAAPMTRGEYNKLRGWEIPKDENPDDDGYVVEYLDGGKANVEGFEGYVSWSPKDVFETAYQPTDALSFGHAIEAMKAGHKVARAGWNGKSMFIVLMSALYLPPFNTQGTDRKVNDRTAQWIGEDKPLDSQPYFAMFTAKEQWQPGWLASQADILANDWQIVGDAVALSKSDQDAPAEKTAGEQPMPDKVQNRLRINNGPWLDIDSDEGKEAIAHAGRMLEIAAAKGESPTIAINGGPDLRLGSAEANEAIAKLKAGDNLQAVS